MVSKLRMVKTKEMLKYCVPVSQLIHLPLVVLDKHMRISTANHIFYKSFHTTPKKALNNFLFGTGHKDQWDIPKISSLLKNAMHSKKDFFDFAVTYDFPNVGVRHVTMSGQKINWIGKEPPSILLTIRDITLQKKLEQKEISEAKLSKVLEIVTCAANASMSLEEVSQSLLEAICIYTGWEVGNAHLLKNIRTPISLQADTATYQFNQTKKNHIFWKQFAESKPTDSGLPILVLETGKLKWLLDISKDPRFTHTTFKQSGVKAAFAFPVLIEGKVVAILEFFSSKTDEPDRKFLTLMEGVGNQIGQVVQRKRIEDENAALLIREHDARAKAEKDNRTKDFFLATLSHELRTPLTSILLWVQIAKDIKSDTAKIKQALDAIEISAMTQEKLINDLLDTSRIIMGKLSLEMNPVDLSSVIRTTIQSLQPAAKYKSITMETQIDSSIGTVSADALRLQQIFWNLISNSIKFSFKDGTILIKLERVIENSLSYAQVSVIDTGEGIPSQFLPHVFDWFSQADNSRIREHNGLGLGLAISRNLIELQGGTIHVNSKGINTGATMTTRLPLKDINTRGRIQNYLEQNMTTKSVDSKNIDISLKGVRVLIIDNEESIVKALSIVLNSYEAEVEVALSGPDGLVLFHEFKPHVILCDIAMPLEDGYAFIRKIRALDPANGALTPAIALTAYAGDSDVKNAVDAGYQTHVAKPIDMPKLVQAVAILAAKGK